MQKKRKRCKVEYVDINVEKIRNYLQNNCNHFIDTGFECYCTVDGERSKLLKESDLRACYYYCETKR